MADTDHHETQIYQLRAVLRGISPLIWRRLLVRSDSTVAQLHQALQVAFGWDDEHLNRFEIRGREYAVYRDGGGMIGIDARGVRPGVAVRAHDRGTLERLCRYITRPALATGRLALTPQGRVRYTLKTPYRDGTTHVIFEPLDFMARLAALVPRPRVHLTRYHGVFAPHSSLRAQITPAGRGTRKPATEYQSPAEQHRAMSWAQRLKRVFKLDLESCEGCGGQIRVIACIEDPLVIWKILSHLERQQPSVTTVPPLPARGPPNQGVLELS